jgi:hypothetical protein
MIGLLIGLGIAFVIASITFSIINYTTEGTINPFYMFTENVKSGGWVMLVIIFTMLPIYGYAIHDKCVRLEKCDVEWKFDEQTGNVKIDVTGSKVKDAVINFESKQN